METMTVYIVIGIFLDFDDGINYKMSHEAHR